MKIRCCGEELMFDPNIRDSCMLWHDNPFMLEGKSFGDIFLEIGKLDVIHGWERDSSWERPHRQFLGRAERFYDKLREDEDLLKYDYFYLFSSKGGSSQGGGQSGFLVDGYYGSIDAMDKPFLTLTLSETAPSGKGRDVHIIDLRNQTGYQTDELGVLKRRRRKGKFEIKDKVEELIEFLNKYEAENVTIVPTWQR